MKKTRLKKIKCKRIFAFSAVLIVLYAFLVIPASATSNIIYSSSESSQDVPSMSCPVPIDISFDVVRVNSSVDGVEDRSYYGFAASLSSIAYLGDVGSSFNVSTQDNLPSNYVWSGVVSPVSSSLEFFDLYPDRDNDVSFIGTYKTYYSGFKFSNSLDTNTSSQAPYSYLPGHTPGNIYLSDFYMWNKIFDERITTNSEISLSFYTEYSQVRPASIEFYYSLVGDSTINYLYFNVSDLDSSDDANFDIFNFSPSILGITDPDAVVYVHQCRMSFYHKPYIGNNTILPNVAFYINAEYTFNPYLDNFYVTLPDDPSDPDDPNVPIDPDNPAIALSRYTEWIGDALGGFLDFNIFPGFTLGGIFMTLLAFSCVVWFLKLVAGG